MQPLTSIIAKIVLTGLVLCAAAHGTAPLRVEGMSVTPHFKLDTMEYLRPPEPAAGARVQLFLKHDAAANGAPLPLDRDTRVLFDGRTPSELLEENAWAWHDMPGAAPDEIHTVPPGALVVWNFNGRALPFGPGGRFPAELGPEETPWFSGELALETPDYWLSTVTFLGPDTAIQPDTMVVHVANASDADVTIKSCRLWLPHNPKSPQVLFAQPFLETLDLFNGRAEIPAGDRGGFSVSPGPLPLTFGAVEVVLAPPGKPPVSIWGYLRIKPERFDISGGWVRPVTSEIYLKTLHRLHINTAHLATTPGYTDTELYDRYPLRYFHRLQPFETYDTDEMLARIHAVEFLGEPQFGGGRPVPPQEVWEALRPYAFTRMATSVTHSEERIWRDYAGLSDYPHYNAYRVTAPSADIWRKYERWEGRIGWGAPLETIGDLCRSLRELNRPMPCATWSQGPHHGWGRYGGRERTTPTPDEIRMQAYHALSTRITSLYWFNLSLPSLVGWRDTLGELGRIGREIRMLDEFYLEGDAYTFERLYREDGAPDWDIASVCGPRAAVLFALDLDYAPDPEDRVFTFGPPRPAAWRFTLPAYLKGIADVFRVDADGVYEVVWSATGNAVEIEDTASRAMIYLATSNPDLRHRIEARRQKLIEAEHALDFDPAHNDEHFAVLETLWNSSQEE